MVTPEWPDREVDEQFARIVAGWALSAPTSGSAGLAREDSVATPSAGPSPGATPSGATPSGGTPLVDRDPPADREPLVAPPDPDATAADPSAGTAGTPSTANLPTAAGTPVGKDTTGAPADDDDLGSVWRGYRPAEIDEHFQPPDPPVPSARDATYWLSVVGLAGGPLLAIWAAVLSGNPDPGWLIVIGVLMTFAGFGLLVMRGSTERDPDDNGARV